jgi:hypothetical protein
LIAYLELGCFDVCPCDAVSALSFTCICDVMPVMASLVLTAAREPDLSGPAGFVAARLLESVWPQLKIVNCEFVG